MYQRTILLLLICFSSLSFASEPVTPHPNPSQLLTSSDPQLERNKKLVYDFYRIVLHGWRLERTAEFLKETYIQHNPNVPTGRQGFIDFFTKISKGRTKPVPATLPRLVSLQAEADLVTLSFVWNLEDSETGEAYTSTWFDMFRIENGKIAEHWDNAKRH